MRRFMGSLQKRGSHSAVKRLAQDSPQPPAKLPRLSSAGVHEAMQFSSRQRSRLDHPGRRHSQPLRKPVIPILEGPLHSRDYISSLFPKLDLPANYLANPKYTITNARYKFTTDTKQGRIHGVSEPHFRTTINVSVDPPIRAVGDGKSKKEAEELATLHALYILFDQGFLFGEDTKQVTLSNGTTINVEKSKEFMEFYCRRFNFPRPEVAATEIHGGWEATLSVGGRRIGLGAATSKKSAINQCYLDVVQYLEKSDPELWQTFMQKAKSGDVHGYTPSLYLNISNTLNSDIRNLCVDLEKSSLYANRPKSSTSHSPSAASLDRLPRAPSAVYLAEKSKNLLDRRQKYLRDPVLEKMRDQRTSLPVYTRAGEVLENINQNEVTILMAATGSGKTTQIPQLILDSYIEKEEGALCNVLCTQPRRLAAVSVADRVAKERGENLGRSVGYQVRFEQRMPEDHGSITFCTTGVFLKRLQTALEVPPGQRGNLDHITHVVVDEVHERDVDTDLLLVVLKRLLNDRKKRNLPLKVVLMSATIDPTLFQNYFLDAHGNPAKVVNVPGRSFPVKKHFLADFVGDIQSSSMRWTLEDKSSAKFITRELGPEFAPVKLDPKDISGGSAEDLDIPYTLIAATISHVLRKSDDGHVLVFLPGWEDITAVQRTLQRPSGPLGQNFLDETRYSIHLLHSSIPLAEQQQIFEPAGPGVRRIILATNIAETSVTIPDVVYVVDCARHKEQRYDPEAHIMSLVSAWVGASNLNQRAGRAGRHRPGEYYGILSKEHADRLEPYQTVEMSRVDLTNVVMHVKALNFPGMAVEDVLAATIEPPSAERVASAMRDLQMVGALDDEKNLTSLGRVLLQLPVEVQVGKLVLYGSFFRCLDQALTLAAILTNRDPFVSPMHLKAESAAKKNSWASIDFRSDAFATLQAYNAWDSMMQRREFDRANRFCIDNFLAKPTLVMIQKIKTHLLQSLYAAGVIDISAGGGFGTDWRYDRQQPTIPPELNENGSSKALLATLVAMALRPKFAIRVNEKTFRTQHDRITFIHPSSVNHRKHQINLVEENQSVKAIYAFQEKRRNLSIATSGTPMTYLVSTTRLEPLLFLLFGAAKVERSDTGLKCDGWIPLIGNLNALEDLAELKGLFEGCMLRVYEGLILNKQQRRNRVTTQPRDTETESWDDEDALPLSQEEVTELDLLTRDLVGILNAYDNERMQSASRQVSRPATPLDAPRGSMRYPHPASTHGTPYGSRAPTPTRLVDRLRRHL